MAYGHSEQGIRIHNVFSPSKPFLTELQALFSSTSMILKLSFQCETLRGRWQPSAQPRETHQLARHSIKNWNCKSRKLKERLKLSCFPRSFLPGTPFITRIAKAEHSKRDLSPPHSTLHSKLSKSCVLMQLPTF